MIDRTEATGFGVAIAGHVVLLAALALGLVKFASEAPPSDAIEVSFVDDIAAVSSAPQLTPEPPAPAMAPEAGAIEDAAPAMPTAVPTPPEARPTQNLPPLSPTPRQRPEPPRQQPQRTMPRPTPAPPRRPRRARPAPASAPAGR